MGNLKYYDESRKHFVSAHLSCYFPLYHGRGLTPGSESPTFDQILAQNAAFSGAPIPTIAVTQNPTASGKHGGNPNHYNCLSWKGANAPVLPYVSPRKLFDRLFAVAPSGGVAPPMQDPSAKRSLAQKRLYLDKVVDQIKSINARAGSEDKRRLDEYLTGVEELDVKTQALLNEGAGDETPAGTMCALGDPPNDPRTYPQIQSLMQDLMVRAFQCGLTKIGTYMLEPPSGAHFPSTAYVPGQTSYKKNFWHGPSHWSSVNDALHRDLQLVTGWHYDRTIEFLQKLDAVQEGDNTLLDNTLVCFGTSMSFAAHHSDRIYQILVGGKGVIKHGQDIDAGLAGSGNLWSTVIQGFTGTAPTVGKSTGTLSGLV